MNNWKGKVFKSDSGLVANKLYIGKCTAIVDAEDNKVKFQYEIIAPDGGVRTVNRRIPSNQYQLTRWLKQHSYFDPDDSELTQLMDSEHLVLLGQYEDFSFAQRVFPLLEEGFSDD